MTYYLFLHIIDVEMTIYSTVKIKEKMVMNYSDVVAYTNHHSHMIRF